MGAVYPAASRPQEGGFPRPAGWGCALNSLHKRCISVQIVTYFTNYSRSYCLILLFDFTYPRFPSGAPRVTEARRRLGPPACLLRAFPITKRQIVTESLSSSLPTCAPHLSFLGSSATFPPFQPALTLLPGHWAQQSTAHPSTHFGRLSLGPHWSTAASLRPKTPWAPHCPTINSGRERRSPCRPSLLAPCDLSVSPHTREGEPSWLTPGAVLAVSPHPHPHQSSPTSAAIAAQHQVPQRAPRALRRSPGPGGVHHRGTHCRAGQYRAAHHCAVQCSAVEWSAVECSAVQCSGVECSGGVQEWPTSGPGS